MYTRRSAPLYVMMLIQGVLLSRLHIILLINLFFGAAHHTRGKGIIMEKQTIEKNKSDTEAHRNNALMLRRKTAFEFQ